MLSPEMFLRVQRALAEIESTRGVRVLYACESGSRAWGFASEDSDYDVRFLYVHPRDWYLAVDERRDVIECPLSDELDVSGWELRKALRLLRKSNPPLLEWLQSPIVYQKDEAFFDSFWAVSHVYYSEHRSFMHYLQMAFGNWRKYVLGREEVVLKKYLYVFRPVLACRWVERGLGQVPMLFQTAVDAVLDEASVRAALEDLLARKRANAELGAGPADLVLSGFLAQELARLDACKMPSEAPADPGELNRVFREFALAA